MPTQNTQFDFGDGITPTSPFTLYEYIITDRGSKYSVSIGYVENRDDIKSFLTTLKSPKQYQKADHHSYAARVAHEGALYETKHDDGETGAGMVILRIMQKRNVRNGIIAVTRWFGGTKLEGDRFRHLGDATTYAINTL
jgi:putative IMPACT (imprinted ancient) family translation regulator